MLLDISTLDHKTIKGHVDFADFGHQIMAEMDGFERQKEHFFVFGLDTKNGIQYIDRVSTGTLDAALIHPREVFRHAVAAGVSSIALLHNHPSGDVTPSNEDTAVTKRLIAAGTTLGIDVLDHIIVSSKTNIRNDFSFQAQRSWIWNWSPSNNENAIREPSMANSDDELEAFKRLSINFAAAAFGYRIDKKKSSKHSAVMIGKDGYKIICSTSNRDGHGIFFSTGGQTSGSIIDLVQHVTGANLGGVRKALRPLLQAGGFPSDLETGGWKLEPAATDFLGVLARFSNFEPVTSPHPFLSVTRQIPDRVLLSERFANRVFHDSDRGTAIFPHYGSPDGSKDRCLTGYVIKHDALTMFSKGGKKGLWPSNALETDTQLIISEAAIDCLSYAALQTDISIARFISTGGQLNPEQPALIQSAIEKLAESLPPNGCGEVVAAVDNDQGGDLTAAKLSNIFEQANHRELSFRVDVPPTRGDDWNSVLTRSP